MLGFFKLCRVTSKISLQKLSLHDLKTSQPQTNALDEKNRYPINNTDIPEMTLNKLFFVFNGLKWC